jgi:hypothetical protein
MVRELERTVPSFCALIFFFPMVVNVAITWPLVPVIPLEEAPAPAIDAPEISSLVIPSVTVTIRAHASREVMFNALGIPKWVLKPSQNWAIEFQEGTYVKGIIRPKNVIALLTTTNLHKVNKKKVEATNRSKHPV